MHIYSLEILADALQSAEYQINTQMFKSKRTDFEEKQLNAGLDRLKGVRLIFQDMIQDADRIENLSRKLGEAKDWIEEHSD